MGRIEAIERVADKRYNRLCETMPEQEAAEKVAKYLREMADRSRMHAPLVHIQCNQMAEAYEQKIKPLN